MNSASRHGIIANRRSYAVITCFEIFAASSAQPDRGPCSGDRLAGERSEQVGVVSFAGHHQDDAAVLSGADQGKRQSTQPWRSALALTLGPQFQGLPVGVPL